MLWRSVLDGVWQDATPVPGHGLPSPICNSFEKVQPAGRLGKTFQFCAKLQLVCRPLYQLAHLQALWTCFYKWVLLACGFKKRLHIVKYSFGKCALRHHAPGAFRYSAFCISCTSMAPQCTLLHCTALHCTALHCTALHCTALHCTAPPPTRQCRWNMCQLRGLQDLQSSATPLHLL